MDELHVIMMSYRGSRARYLVLYIRRILSKDWDGVVHVFQLDWRLSCRIVYVQRSCVCVAIVCPLSAACAATATTGK